MPSWTAPLRLIGDFALPPRCPGCGAVAEADHRFCVACWSQLRFIGPPWCARCCAPFDTDYGPGALCGQCLDAPPRHAGARAAVAYDEISRRAVLRLKYGGRIGNAETLGRLMARLVPADAELLVPVPLHRWRIWGRGFNQAALIAQALSRITRLPTAAGALIRVRPSGSMRGLRATRRAALVRGAFRVAQPERVEGRSVVLVDDVHASGATANACTAQLLTAGASRVTVLCWARVLDQEGRAG